MRVLKVTVGEPIAKVSSHFVDAFKRVRDGKKVKPYCGVGFRTPAEFGSVFTEKRWRLIETLKATGPMSIKALAEQLGRDYKNVHSDVGVMITWLAIENDDAGRIFVPWDRVDVKCLLNASE